MFTSIFIAVVAAVAAGFVVAFFSRKQSISAEQLSSELRTAQESLVRAFSASTTELGVRLEQTKGDLRQEVTDRLNEGFRTVTVSVEEKLAGGRTEQTAQLQGFTSTMETRFDSLRSTTELRLEGFAQSQGASMGELGRVLEAKFSVLAEKQSSSLAEARQELSSTLHATTAALKAEIQAFKQGTEQSLETIRGNVDAKLAQINDQVQRKLDENIREGFAQFEKVQLHLKAAEEQLRNVGALGNSINDLNNLLKLPHLRGKFGEASLERLLGDFLPAHMFSLQASAGAGNGRADAVIHFPAGELPIDAKFPREQILPLFESSDAAQLAAAREQLVRVMKAEAKRIAQYISPEAGTTEVALMYLPSETLYFEVVRSQEVTDALHRANVFPVSPNTLLMTVRTIALAHKWYEIASQFEETRVELGKAQKSLGYFEKQFEKIGKELTSAQKAYDTAATHFRSYQKKVTAISGVEVPGVEQETLALAASAGEE